MTDARFQYSQPSLHALLRIYDNHKWARHAMVRVSIVRSEGDVRKRTLAHWRYGSLDNEPIKWLALPALSRDAMLNHASQPDSVIGIVPAILGLVVLDIDRKSPDAVEEVHRKYGPAVQCYPTLSGGWHALYHGHSIEDMKTIGAGAFLVDGEHYGEVCSARRYANCWSPVVFERAVNSWTIDTPKLTAGAIERAPVSAPDGDGGGRGGGYPLEVIIEALRLRPDPASEGEYMGHCPICDTDNKGGGTRFKARTLQDGSVMLNCWSCSPSGFHRKTFARLMSIIRKHDAPNRKSMLSNLINRRSP